MSRGSSRANLLYLKYDTADPFNLCWETNVGVQYADIRTTRLSKYVIGLDEPIILLSSLLKEKNERYFILAYELYFALCSAEVSEKDAHLFAKELLEQLYIDTYGHVPGTAKELEKLYGLPDITDASIF